MLFNNEQFNILQINNVVHYAPKGHKKYNYPGKLPTYELMYYEKGDVVITFNGQTIHITEGDILFLPKGINNKQYTIYVNEDFCLYNIYFDTKDYLPKEAIKITPGNIDFQTDYEKVYKIWLHKRSGYYYKTMQGTYNILDKLRSAQLKYCNKNNLFYRIDEYITEHYCDTKFDYSMLIMISGLSYSYFKKLFINNYGYPPVKYITRLKIKLACKLLQTTKLSISEISEICGFENVYYFSNVFKKQMGISPKNYRHY